MDRFGFCNIKQRTHLFHTLKTKNWMTLWQKRHLLESFEEVEGLALSRLNAASVNSSAMFPRLGIPSLCGPKGSPWLLLLLLLLLLILYYTCTSLISHDIYPRKTWFRLWFDRLDLLLQYIIRTFLVFTTSWYGSLLGLEASGLSSECHPAPPGSPNDPVKTWRSIR